MAKAKPKLFTVGYEQTPAKSVLDELQNAGVKLLVDVRAVASSRRPGFSKNQLAAGLDERGISYLHLRGLGTPKEGREAARSGDFKTLSRIYQAHLETAQAKEELDELSAWSPRPDQSACCVMSATCIIVTGSGLPKSLMSAATSRSNICCRRNSSEDLPISELDSSPRSLIVPAKAIDAAHPARSN